MNTKASKNGPIHLIHVVLPHLYMLYMTYIHINVLNYYSQVCSSYVIDVMYYFLSSFAACIM